MPMSLLIDNGCLQVQSPPYYLPTPPFEYSHNFTQEALTTSNLIWLLPIGQALTTVANNAMALRLLSSEMAEREQEFAKVWCWVWCVFLDLITTVASTLPPAALVISALGTTAKDILLETLPQALSLPLQGLVAGKHGLQYSHLAVQNISLLSLQHLELALVLGAEALLHGRTRVANAVFHGDISYEGQAEYTVHRSDAFLSALSGEFAEGSARVSEVPRVVEIGVHYGDFAYRLLRRHPTLQWIGVDPFECDYEDQDLERYRSNFSGSDILRIARGQLREWLGTRAQFIIARSSEVVEAELGTEPIDAVFVDAIHTQEAVFEDLALWAPRVRPGGLVAGHDYAFGNEGVVEAVHASIPPGCTLHLGPNAVYWWQSAPPGSSATC